MIVVFLGLGATIAQAQPPTPPEPASIRGDSPQTRKRLTEARQKLLVGSVPDALDDLQRIIDEAGDDLVLVDGRCYRPARWVAHQALTQLPHDVLRAYQARIDDPARKLLAAGRQNRDPRPLRQLLDRYFVSAPATEALLTLGDMLFERGDFRAAETHWRRLLPDAGADVVHPNSAPDPAGVRARLILAAIFQEDVARARPDLVAFQAAYPGATGVFAGKKGPYADALQSFLDHPPPQAPEIAGREWPTFAGGPNRTGRLAGPIPSRWPPRPAWVADLPIEPQPDAARGASAPGHPPFGYPIIANGRVYVTDGNRLLSFSLADGKIAEHSPLFGGGVPASGSVGCSIMSAGGRLFARIARRAAFGGRPEGKHPEDVAIVCYEPVSKQGPLAASLRELWRLPPPVVEGKPPTTWAGPPLVSGGRMWAALRRVEEGRVVHSVACYDPADPDLAPRRPLWLVDVCDSPVFGGGDNHGREELLTLAGPNVVLCANEGAVNAVDATTGRRAWAFQYSRAARRVADAARGTSATPAVSAGGRVFVAPADADQVYALDEETGQLLWGSDPTEGAQILGVIRNRVIVTTTGPVRGLRALSVKTGQYRQPDGWIQAAGGGVLTYGRGFVADGVIVWPSLSGLYFLDPETGLPRSGAAPLRPLNYLPGVRGGPPKEAQRLPATAAPTWPLGHLAYADGVLVVVTPTQVWGYRTDAPPEPPSAPGLDRRASFQAALDATECDIAEGRRHAATERLLAAAHSDDPADLRAWAVARLLSLIPSAPSPDQLPAEVRAAIKPELLDEWLLTTEGEFVTLRALLERQTGRAPPPRKALPPPSLPNIRRPEAPPSLLPTAEVFRTVRLPPSAQPLRVISGAMAGPGHLFVATPREVIAISLTTGTTRSANAPDLFTHAADLPAGFVAVGPFIVAVYGAAAEPIWVFRVPRSEPLPSRLGLSLFRTGGSPSVPEMSSFRLAGARLFARVGEHHIVSLDLEDHRVVWSLGAHGRPRYEPIIFPGTPRFEPEYLTTGHLVLIQLSDGRKWSLNVDTGCPTEHCGAMAAGQTCDAPESRTSQVPWVHPPVEVGPTRVAFSDGPGLVRMVSPTSGVVKWCSEAGGQVSLTGEPPQVRAGADSLLVAVRRNHGVDLDRLDPADGKSFWAAGPAFLDTSRIDLTTCDADLARVYLPIGGKLSALGLDDGRTTWEVDFPGMPAPGGWVVRAGPNVVVAYPLEAVPQEPVERVWSRAVESFLRLPLSWRLPWLGVAVYDTWAARTVPVLLFDPESGRLQKVIRIPARGPRVICHLEGELAVVATGDRVVWLR